VHADGCHHCIALGINNTHVARSRIDDVDLVLLAVGSDAGRVAAHVKRLGQPEEAQVNHADGVALAVADISEFAKGGPVVGHLLLAEIPPPHPAEDRNQHSDEKEFSQGSES